MIGVPCDELMGIHPHEAGSDIKHLVVVRDRVLLHDLLEGQGVGQIVKAFIFASVSTDGSLWQLPHL